MAAIVTKKREIVMEKRNLSKLDHLTLTLERQENGAFVATSPEVPELLAEGSTLQETLQVASDALASLEKYFQEKVGEKSPRRR